MLHNNLIVREQHGFLPKKLYVCITQLLTDMDHECWTDVLNTGDAIDVLYLDFNVPHTRLATKKT